VEFEVLIRALAPSKVLGRRPAEIRSLVCDARRVEADALFVCVSSVLFAAFFVIIANRLVDIAYAALDPRVRYG
jgi:hypothetical protein